MVGDGGKSFGYWLNGKTTGFLNRAKGFNSELAEEFPRAFQSSLIERSRNLRQTTLETFVYIIRNSIFIVLYFCIEYSRVCANKFLVFERFARHANESN